MGGSPKIPQKSDEDKEMERLQKKLLEFQLKQAQQPVQLPELKLPPPPPPADPPVLQSSADAVEAARDERRKALNRINTGNGTRIAGETKTPGTGKLGGGKTLLS